MRSITKLILSILTFAFALWATLIAYKIWNGQPGAGDFQASLLIIVFLVLSCTYFIATTVQQGFETVTGKKIRDRKLDLYQKTLTLYMNFLQRDKSPGTEQYLAEINVIKASLTIYANVRVLQSFNQLDKLVIRQDSGKALSDSLVSLMLTMRSDLGRSNISMKSTLVDMLRSVEDPE